MTIYSPDLSLRDYLHGVTGEYTGHKAPLPCDLGCTVGVDAEADSMSKLVAALQKDGEFEDDGNYRLQLLPGIEGEQALIFLRRRGLHGGLELWGRIRANRELEMALVTLTLDRGERIFADPSSNGSVRLYAESRSLQSLIEQILVEEAESHE